MIAVYILISPRDNNRYIGSTSNLGKRLKEHQKGLVKSTKNRRPLKLYAFQECLNIADARKTEKRYKTSRGSYEKAIKTGKLIIIGE